MRKTTPRELGLFTALWGLFTIGQGLDSLRWGKIDAIEKGLMTAGLFVAPVVRAFLWGRAVEAAKHEKESAA